VNVAPYAGTPSMPTRDQLLRTLAALRREGGDKLFISSVFTPPPMLAAIQQAGFVSRAQVAEGSSVISELVAAR
jgi:hypothetical protein